MSNVTISDTLYHFTGFGGQGKTPEQALNTLKEIIQSSCLILSKNEISWGYSDDQGRQISGISFNPYMTCFTETPIQFSGQHMRDFGCFGIGFNIDWVISNKGQNVVYVRDGSVNRLGDTLSRMITHLSIDRKSPEFPRKYMHEIVWTTENMKWRHEREWRIIGDTAKRISFDNDHVDEIVCAEKFMGDFLTFLTSDTRFLSLVPKVKSI